MKLHWTDLAVAAVLVGASCVAIYAGFARLLRLAVAERQQETDRKINAMATTVQALQSRVAELNRLQAQHTQEGNAAAATSAEIDDGPKKDLVKPEIVAALTAAATAFLGKKAAHSFSAASAGGTGWRGRMGATG